jgi:ribosomal protein L11 methyltransferase
MTFFDVGTGTGILAIASAKLANGNNKQIIACDIDEESVHQAQRNAFLNNVNIEIFHGSITKESPKYDFICANLTLEVILPLLPILIEKTTQVLVLSGIMKDQKEKIRQELLKYQLTSYEIEALNEWIAVIVTP